MAEWQCENCTLKNNIDITICEVCGEPKPAESKNNNNNNHNNNNNNNDIKQNDDDKDWECSKCTLKNKQTALNCDACGSINPSTNPPQKPNIRVTTLWEWKGGGKWHEYPDEISGKIESAYYSGKLSFSLFMASNEYIIDLTKLQQINKSSKKTRRIQRVQYKYDATNDIDLDKSPSLNDNNNNEEEKIKQLSSSLSNVDIQHQVNTNLMDLSSSAEDDNDNDIKMKVQKLKSPKAKAKTPTKSPKTRTKTKTPKRPKDINAPKRPQSSYFLFQNSVRATYKQNNPNLKSNDILKMISSEWKNMDQNQKSIYENQHKIEKEKYEKLMNEYKKTKKYNDYLALIKEWKDNNNNNKKQGNKQKKQQKNTLLGMFKKDTNIPQPIGIGIGFGPKKKKKRKFEDINDNNNNNNSQPINKKRRLNPNDNGNVNGSSPVKISTKYALSGKHKGIGSVLNKDLIEALWELSTIERNAGRRHRANAYSKACKSLREHGSKVTSGAEALRLDGVGAKIAAKIDELLTTGHLVKLDKLRADDTVQAVNELCQVHGIGPKKAAELVHQYKICDIDALRNRTDLLNNQQRIGLKYFEYINCRIPRDECTAIGNIVRNELDCIDSSIIMDICGSYRRGKPDCGDVDILFTHKDDKYDNKMHSKQLLNNIIARLRNINLLVEDLAHGPVKYMGICRFQNKKNGDDGNDDGGGDGDIVPGNFRFDIPSLDDDVNDNNNDNDDRIIILEDPNKNKMDLDDDNKDHKDAVFFRRIDLKFINYKFYYANLLYFTGSDRFNVHQRLKANEKGLILNENGIYKMLDEDDHSKKSKEPIITPNSEKDIFDAIGMDYLKPQDRSW